MPHLALLGDSVFDNAAYTDGGPAVIDHVRKALPQDWQAELLAVDGSTTTDIEPQLAKLPADVTHIVLSVGGNDALLRADLLDTPVQSSGDALRLLSDATLEFGRHYERVVASCLASGRTVVPCTIYNGNFPDPNYQSNVRVALSAFNDAVFATAIRHGLRLIDLRHVCDSAEHFANPIEPSVLGGERIAAAIARAVAHAPFAGPGAHVVT